MQIFSQPRDGSRTRGRMHARTRAGTPAGTHVLLGVAVANLDVVASDDGVVALVAAAEHEALGLVVRVRVVGLEAHVLQLRLEVEVQVGVLLGETDALLVDRDLDLIVRAISDLRRRGGGERKDAPAQKAAEQRKRATLEPSIFRRHVMTQKNVH